jgi:hypothetical protein
MARRRETRAAMTNPRVPYAWLTDPLTWVKQCTLIRVFWDGSCLCGVQSQQTPIVVKGTDGRIQAPVIDEVVVMDDLTEVEKVAQRVSSLVPRAWARHG